jgi:GNAT superfamily N-acetyltransferase
MTEFTIRRLSDNDERPPFNCDDNDLNEFFAIDSIKSTKELMSVTYVVEDNMGELQAFFSLSNDAVKKAEVEKSIIKKILRIIPREKRYSTLPAVKICRLATAANYQSKGTGSEILNYLKFWFTNGNKTGCRFIIVDAYNNPRTLKFYERNGFIFLSSDPEQTTRLMIFDLATVKE